MLYTCRNRCLGTSEMPKRLRICLGKEKEVVVITTVSINQLGDDVLSDWLSYSLSILVIDL